MIGILTFHAAHNFGSNLQAYALQHYLFNQGYDNEIINFRPEMQKNIYSAIIKEKSLGSISKSIYNVMHLKLFTEQYKKFEDFIENSLKKSDYTYIDENTVKQICKKYDAIICGSDQVWNRNSGTKDKSWIYYLDFEYKGRKIAYAPSMGGKIELEDKQKQLALIEKFDFVSVRENSLAEYLKCNGINADVVCDPTLLLNSNNWEELGCEEIQIKKPYLLFYSINCDRKVAETAAKIGGGLGLKVICPVLHPRLVGMQIEYVPVGPKGFLNLVKNASFICTNSFHGTVFSVIYKKNFISIFTKDRADARRKDFLKSIGCKKNIYNLDNDSIKNFILNPPTCTYDDIFDELILYSKNYLHKTLEAL